VGRGGGAPLLVTLKGMINKALEIDVCFYRGPDLENMERRSFPRALERRKIFFYLEKFL
jgi:hypothetical protein